MDILKIRGKTRKTSVQEEDDIVRMQKTVTGAYYGLASPHETFRTMIELYLKGDLLIDEIIERRYNLEEINEGFEALERGENGRGVLVFN